MPVSVFSIAFLVQLDTLFFLHDFYIQLDMSLERLRLAVDDLLVRFAEKFAAPKLQHLFLLNNYDMSISILKVSFFP